MLRHSETLRATMKTQAAKPSPPSGLGLGLGLGLAAAAAIGVVGLLGIAGWSAEGDTLFWSLLQSGLAWCL
jgi:hypothetical protein